MKRNYALATTTMALLAVLLAIAAFPSNITGAASYLYEGEERDTYAYSLNDWVRGFYQVEEVVFPRGVCTSVIDEIYDQTFYRWLSSAEDLSTQGPQRTSSIMFAFEGDAAGALELIYGKNLLNLGDIDSSIHFIAEAPVRIPKLTRVSSLELELYGVARDKLYITEGTLTLPTLKCDFVTENGQAVCDCKRTGRTYDYAAGKIGSNIFNGQKD